MDAFTSATPVTAHVAGGTTVQRSVGSGSPVLLLHGYPQTHICWRRVATGLADNHLVVAPDLPGYGRSNFPTENDEPYAKRSMAQAMVELMADLGYERFAVVGHDRGGRVAYRMALDHPEVVSSLTVIDIVPTIDEWDLIDGISSVDVFHWPFLAQPKHLVEPLLAGRTDNWVDRLLDSWSTDPAAIDDEARTDYRQCFRRPEVITGTCADYRTGATIDLDHDRHDRATGRSIECPVLVLASETRGDIDDIWRRWGRNVEVRSLAGGHFLPEENPGAVVEHLLPFLTRG